MICADNAKKCSAVLPRRLTHVDEPHVGFVDERCRLQRVVGPLLRHVLSRNLSKLAVHERRQPCEGVLVTVPPRLKQARDLMNGR